MTRFDSYRDCFPNAHLIRSESGVLEVALHAKGGVLVFDGVPTSSLSICYTRSALMPTIEW
jgi:hypothetical protein